MYKFSRKKRNRYLYRMIFNPILFQALAHREEHKSPEQLKTEAHSRMCYYEAKSRGELYDTLFVAFRKTIPTGTPTEYIKCQTRALRAIAPIESILYETETKGTEIRHRLFIQPKLDDYSTALSSMILDFDKKFNPTNWFGFKKNKTTQFLTIWDGESYLKPTDKAIQL